MDDAYSPVGVGEALYAELDRESVRSANPSYQNTAYSQCGEVRIIWVYSVLKDFEGLRTRFRCSFSRFRMTDFTLFQGHEQDMPMVSSAPSSAYYSDLSVTAMPTGADRAYEVVGLTMLSGPLQNWDVSGDSSGSSGGLTVTRRPPRLAAINESTTTVPSDYV